ncbi:hypothetical protein B0T10DRAFT_403904 [Thelonectria olida]|uniref:Uncharacterized protein n=1 Tax=Thelonectria olida TaxID=1576542 RepID=A0A9P8W5D3_9HYPO|nr:hypothetical protein B0T10DRAFT_403904 [Thelonectria olida]
MDNVTFYPPQLETRRTPKPSQSPDPVSLVKTFLKGFPKGEADWDHEAPQDQEGIDKLHDELTLSKVPCEQRAKMNSMELLQKFAEEHTSLLQGKKSQIHCLVFTALGIVAIDFGCKPRMIDQMAALHMGTEESAIRAMRLGVKKWNKTSKTLRDSWLPRADELPLRRECMILTVKKFSDEAIGILGRMAIVDDGRNAILDDIKVYLPRKQLSSFSLSLPNILHELHGKALSGKEVRYVTQLRVNDAADLQVCMTLIAFSPIRIATYPPQRTHQPATT